MTKEEAAEVLGVSTRAVERYTKAGRLSVTYEKGKTRSIAVYDAEEVKALEAELEHSPYPARPAIASPVETAIATRPDTGRSELSEFAALVARANLEASGKKTTPSISDIAQKIMLTLSDAALLTSLSRNHLRQAIEDKKLKARIIGRGWRIKREDLDAYVKRL